MIESDNVRKDGKRRPKKGVSFNIAARKTDLEALRKSLGRPGKRNNQDQGEDFNA
jgi:hypothetical protein